jgi:hypothetical protein
VTRGDIELSRNDSGTNSPAAQSPDVIPTASRSSRRLKIALVLAAAMPWAPVACSGGHRSLGSDSTSGDAPSFGDDGGGVGFGSDPGSSGQFSSGGGGGMPATNSGPCKGGHYSGTFLGLYTSHLTGVGVPIPVAGDVNMTLDQQGTADQTCHVSGEVPVPCNEVFTLKNGVIQGVADALHIGDAAVGGFPYFCTMTGTLDCSTKRLEKGWIQCTYCVGPLADGGLSCSLLDGVAGTTGVGGHFAGPLTADYDIGTLSFIDGHWNGAEALAGNDGTMPGPDGGPVSNYLTPDGGLYLGPDHFGGVGTWTATYDGPKK